MSDNTVAYFQMEKNEKYTLESSEDYRQIGERAYKRANEYFKIFERCYDMVLSGQHMTMATIMAFACELYMKSILFYKEIDCRSTHDLFELYNMCPKDIKKEIKSLHPCHNCSKENFEQELKEVGKAFVVSRYIYERKRMAVNILFLIELLYTLELYTKNIFKD